MIGFNHLGRLGRLGNQMFQYAALRGISTYHGYNICLPYHKEAVDDGIGNMLRTELFDCFTMETLNGLSIQIIDERRPYKQERGFEFDEDLFYNCPDWVSLYGFFQTEKYFKHVEKGIRQDFQFKKEILEPCIEMIGDEKYIALHIRRTDYLINGANHNNLDLNYYENALSNFDKDAKVIVFSDDPNWCKEQELFSDERFLVSENTSGYIDLCLMSMCTDFIIANSTFSWWGAWLSGKGTVVAPKNWFGPALKDKNTKDVYPDHWEIV
jgi:hypothetical protein